eukprot:15455847-Alexandrium_andersonii.AAC.1
MRPAATLQRSHCQLALKSARAGIAAHARTHAFARDCGAGAGASKRGMRRPSHASACNLLH